jgi:hypothetical protein
MKTPVSHDQMRLIIERATRERNAAVAELVAAIARQAIAWLATSAAKLRQARVMAQSARHSSQQNTHLRHFGVSAST